MSKTERKRQRIPPRKRAGSRKIRLLPAAQAEPVRRVGSVTLGICLITAGIFFFAYHFLPNFDALLVLKIVPAAGLVLLGCEVLYYAKKSQRGKYDFVSVFVCLVLMACCFGLTLLPLVWEQVNPEVQQQEQKLRDAYQQSVYEKFQQEASDIRLKDMAAGWSFTAITTMWKS